jgi:hypothetical protein
VNERGRKQDWAEREGELPHKTDRASGTLHAALEYRLSAGPKMGGNAGTLYCLTQSPDLRIWKDLRWNPLAFYR